MYRTEPPNVLAALTIFLLKLGQKKLLQASEIVISKFSFYRDYLFGCILKYSSKEVLFCMGIQKISYFENLILPQKVTF